MSYLHERPTNDVDKRFRTLVGQLHATLANETQRLHDEGAGYDEFLALYREYQEKERQMERQMMNEAEKIDKKVSLVTNSKGGRTTNWLTRERKIFATGSATSCFTVTIVHPKVGIAASHISPVRTEDEVKFMLDLVQDEEKAREFLKLPRAEHLRARIPQQTLDETIDTVVQEAVGEFSALRVNPRPVPDGTVIFMHGLDFMRPEDLEMVRQRAVPTLTGMLESISIAPRRIADRLGERGEVRYGGPSHPQYPKPRFVQF